MSHPEKPITLEEFVADVGDRDRSEIFAGRADELGYAHGDGRYRKLMKKLARTDVIILDDWGLTRLTAPQRRELLDILEDRHRSRSTVVTSQLPVEHWHKTIGEPTHADAILDRLVHNAYRINLKGESMRKLNATANPIPSSTNAL